MKNMSVLHWVSLVLVLVGALNWGLIGFLQVDLVAMLFGVMSMVSRVVYSLVGLAGLYMVFASMKMCK